MLIAFAGLSHLGIVSSIATASKGFSVFGFDPRADLIDQIKAKKLPVLEPGLDETFSASYSQMSFTSNIKEIKNVDIAYISLDVATDSNNVGNLQPLRELIELVDQNLSPQSILVILSQLPPGFMKTLNLNSYREVYYQVETLIFGNALERALKPERFMVGCKHPHQALSSRYETLLEAFQCPILKMRYESAEISKIAINLYLANQVTLTNTIAEICSKTGAVWKEVADSLKLDRRIGPYSYLQPGLGISGGNIERDLSIIARVADQVGANSSLIKTTSELSTYHKDFVLRVLSERVLQKIDKPKIGILGITYKTNTKSVKNSPTLRLISDLKNYQMRAYDPEALWEGEWTKLVQGTSTAYETSENADVLIFMTPWKEFLDLDLPKLKSKMKGKVIIDPFSLFEHSRMTGLGFEHHVLGLPEREA